MGWSKNLTADTKAQSAPTPRCSCWDTDIKDGILMLTPFKRSQINSLRLTMSASVGTRFISVAAQNHQNTFLISSAEFFRALQETISWRILHEIVFFAVQVREVLRNVLNMRREIQFLRVLRSTFHCQSLLIFRDHMICGIYNLT